MTSLYYLMNKEDRVLKFDSKPTMDGYSVLEVYDKTKLPYFIKDNILRFTQWLNDRPISTNQEHISSVLDSLNLSDRSAIDLLKVNNGFSLNDAFWIKPADYSEFSVVPTWIDNNLYFNDFDTALGLVSFFGNTSSLGGTLRTPEITNQGSVGKAWRRINADTLLYKKSSEGGANLGKEHFAEEIASNIAEIVGIPHVRYWSSMWHGKHCSVCPIFTSAEVGYLPMAQFLSTVYSDKSMWTYTNVLSLLSNTDAVQFKDMVVFDFIVENWDRHLSNFGMLVNNSSQKIIGLAPIFDNGYSLMCRDMESDFTTRDFSTYTRKSPFTNLSNREMARFVVTLDKVRYKHWAKLIMTHLGEIISMDCPSWYENGVLQLLQSRCKEIMSV